MTREEMIAYCLDTTNAERKRRGFEKMVPRELYADLSDTDLQDIVANLKALPRDAQGNLVGPAHKEQ